ncbi:MAG: nucleoside 2-deoxyribosyltransferase [candidate division KSB1 bacterium]|nr:nucleoside 2-deoxyribosyltransferase [candidate division KSB1 bacterium]
MRIYFSGSIAGGRRDAEVYAQIVAFLKSRGHEVLTEHVANPGVLELERHMSPREIFRRDMEWLHNCDAVVAEISNPSLGVGYEICQATHLRKPVLCLHREELFISRIILGNPYPRLRVRGYRNPAELLAHVDKFLGELQVQITGEGRKY